MDFSFVKQATSLVAANVSDDPRRLAAFAPAAGQAD
jgi:hypothetical protein